MAGRVDATRTRGDLRALFSKWEIDQFSIQREQEEFVGGRVKRGSGCTVSYLRRTGWQTVSCTHNSDYAVNMRSIFAFLDRIRIAEKSGISYQGLSSTTDLVSSEAMGKTSQDENLEDAYDVLGVMPTDPDDLIKRVYTAKVNSYHPDKGGNADQFKRLQSAYEQVCKARGTRP